MRRAALAVHSAYPREKSVPCPEASFCFSLHHNEGGKDFDHPLYLTKRREKQSRGLRVGFSAQGNAEQRKMR